MQRNKKAVEINQYLAGVRGSAVFLEVKFNLIEDHSSYLLLLPYLTMWGSYFRV